jgi:polysaccharide export outer membrane protein
MKVPKMNTARCTSVLVMVLLAAASGYAQTGGAPSTSPSRPAAPKSNGTAADTSPDYKLVPGDKLRIEVYKDATLSQSLQIRPDGKITLPYVGDIVAAGLTPTALRDSISESLKEYIASPTVTVIVVETQPQTVSVIGEVGTPGVLPIKHQMTVLDALAAAGGFRDFANTKDILIKRNTKTGVQTLRFNYKDAIRSDAKPFYLQPGDIIIVP